MRKYWFPICLSIMLPAACTATGATGLTAAEAAQHAGEQATVCGVVASAHYAEAIEGQPTFINLDQPYPNQIFTILIWGDYRGKFGTPPETWTGRLCATGRIRNFHGKPEIKVIDPSQIRR